MHVRGLCYFCDPAWKHICQVICLSTREGDVVRLALRGMKIARIARELGIKPRTVRHHLHGAYQRLQVEDRVELVVLLFDVYIAWRLGGSHPPECRPKRQPWDD